MRAIEDKSPAFTKAGISIELNLKKTKTIFFIINRSAPYSSLPWIKLYLASARPAAKTREKKVLFECLANQFAA